MTAATGTSSSKSDDACPDPSAHDRQNKLSAQASTAALYVTNPAGKKSSSKSTAIRDDVLTPEGKLSSSSAAASLKYANPKDLPSYPSSGLDASNTAASKAALQAKDYKMKELWQPEQSAAGSKAALNAHKTGKLDLWMPSASSEGNSAATMALGNKGLSPQLDRGYTKDGKSKALLAATQSMNKGRNRAGSTPAPAPPAYPDSNNAVKNALNAATVSHRAKSSVDSNSKDSPAMQAARIQNIGPNVNPEMWGEHPPVQIEEDERKRQAALRASAVSFAKQMYDYQNRKEQTPDALGTEGALRAHARQPSSSSTPDLKAEAMKYIHLQEAANKLAQERLANADKKHEAERYRQYYGYDTQPQRSRLSMRSMRGKKGGRAANAEEGDSDDEETARRIRSQMSALNTGVGEVDKKKQATDRQAVLAAAEKLVQSRMHTMDEKVFNETGKVSPAMMEEWEAKARARAQAESDSRQKNFGKTAIGGGRFMDKSEIEAIAMQRLQPTLDEINDTAEKRRAKDEEIRLEKEEVERQRQKLKEKVAEEKAEQKKMREEQRAQDRVEKETEKAMQRMKKEEQRQMREMRQQEANAAAGGGTAVAAASAPAATSSDKDESADSVRQSTETQDETQDETPRESTATMRTSSGDHTDPHSPALPNKKPDLERHITKIESSDSDDEEEWERADSERMKSVGSLEQAVERREAEEQKAMDEEKEQKKSEETAKDNDDSFAQDVANRVTAEPVAATAARTDGPSKTITTEDTPANKPSKRSRVSGFFGRFKSRRSTTGQQNPTNAATGKDKATDSQPPAFTGGSKLTGAKSKEDASLTASSARAPSDPTTNDTATPRAGRSTSPPISALESEPGRASPSSFRRGASPADISSLSSSGLEEEDLDRGRKGRVARKFGLGKGDKPKKVDVKDGGRRVEASDSESEDDEGAFEEARDTFDESSAPSPAFAGQSKRSASPERTTKFTEEL